MCIVECIARPRLPATEARYAPSISDNSPAPNNKADPIPVPIPLLRSRRAVLLSRLKGRTDFLSRVVLNDQAEQDEEALMTEAKAWQRLKLAHDTHPCYIYPYLDENSQIPVRLSQTWKDFKGQTSRFIEGCHLGELLKARWFESTPQSVSGMDAYGDRYEGNFDRVKPGLLKLNDMMEKYPDQIRNSSHELLTKYTQQVDEILGI